MAKQILKSEITNLEITNIMYEEVKTILSHQLRIAPERITPDAQIKRDPGADYPATAHAPQKRLRHHHPDQELAKFETVNDIVNFLDNLQK